MKVEVTNHTHEGEKKRMKKPENSLKLCVECGVESVDYYFFDVSWAMLCICMYMRVSTCCWIRSI